MATSIDLASYMVVLGLLERTSDPEVLEMLGRRADHFERRLGMSSA